MIRIGRPSAAATRAADDARAKERATARRSVFILRLLSAALLVVALACALVPSAVLAKKADEKKAEKSGDAATRGVETWYTSTIARSEKGVMIVNYWSKGALFRAETVVTGHRINTVVNGGRYYIFNEVAGTGLSIERNSKAIAQDATRGRPFGREYQKMIEGGAERLFEEKIEGVNFEYEVYQLTDQQGRKQLMVTADENRLPVRIENYIRAAGQSSLIEYSGWQRGIKIADSFFEPPSDIEFEEMSYDDYVETLGKRLVGPAPVFYSNLLHGTR